ncbi:MAG: hypothetical protein DIZ80_00540 [endosymbiont of Galathealinum brachiosum]|uniref:Calcineurin-like phosphoesterase domain-containing protein n=1 Tax=endosymbiont of Galathealinum brachiosum TaxID=2200906 RepID=A0A370DNP6_9GAMM|nr:MAG: hypothetical protein DIZ80_00540 [endosymbiont of Galathealinum brachiosum]
MNKQSYDIIGDIHGQADELISLITLLGYKDDGKSYTHPERKIIFLGDFIDRGSKQREVLDIVKAMIENGSALSVMGNHEFNAIAYFTKNSATGEYLRKHSSKNIKQHKAFLDVYETNDKEYACVINWFKTLPLWLELDGLRIVHACWDYKWINKILDISNGSTYLTDELLNKATIEGNWEFDAIETLLKGKEIPLKNGFSFKDKDGNERHNIRVRWWDQSASTYQSAFMGPESARTHIPDDEIEGDHLIEYTHSEPPVFLGHYWMEGEPKVLSKNIACLDFSIAKPGGKLVAYRWDGETELIDEKYVWVERN